MNRKAWLTVGLSLLPGTGFAGTMPGTGVRAMIRDQAGTVETARWGDQGGEQEEVEAPRSGYQGGVADRRRFTAAVACGRCGERGPADRTDSAGDCADPARDLAGRPSPDCTSSVVIVWGSHGEPVECVRGRTISTIDPGP